jgi:hypothetical protein
MGFVKFSILFTILFLAIMWVHTIFSTELHEDAHAAIFQNYGVNSTIKIDYLTGAGSTTPDNSSVQRCSNDDYCVYSHSLNEIISYNITVAFEMVLSVIYLIGLLVGAMYYDWKSIQLNKLQESEEYEEIE